MLRWSAFVSGALSLAFLAACSSSDKSPAAAPPATTDAGATADADVGDAAKAPSTCDPYAARTTAEETLIGPTGLDTSLLQTISGAKKSIDLMAFDVSYKTLLGALDDAKKRGVAVRLVVDHSNSKTARGILGDVVHDSPAGIPQAHASVLLVDGARALVSSFDFTTDAMTKQRNYGAALQEADDVAQLQQIFDHDYAGDTSPVAFACKRVVVTPPLPSGGGRDVVTAHLESAEEKLDLEVTLASDPKVVELLKDRAAAGVPVRLLLAAPELVAGNDKTGADIKAAGAEVRYFRTPEVHAKLAISERGALVGSHELSTDSLDRYREVSVVVTSEDATKKLSAQFESDWSTAALR
jgi:phosphatidylserine/phosphatidylglycerophosphate/cardiolipin synthase-like enzyme